MSNRAALSALPGGDDSSEGWAVWFDGMRIAELPMFSDAARLRDALNAVAPYLSLLTQRPDAALRDQLAMAALPIFGDPGANFRDAAKAAYMMADAMLEARAS